MNNSPTPLQRTAIVLTAIQSETEAVLRHLTEQGRERVADTWFHTGRFASWTVAIAEVGPGNTRAATVAVRAFSHFRPEIAAFVGIAGGVKDVALGDVVVATKVYNHESGKDTAGGFSVRPDLQNSDHELEQRARVLRTSTTWHDRLDASLWPDRKPNVHVGPIAAGEAVVASRKSRIAAHIKTYYGDALAVEMEGRGFLEAAHIESSCRAVVVRGISDRLSGKAQADKLGWQRRASDAAAAFFFEMLALEPVSTSTETSQRPLPAPALDKGPTPISLIQRIRDFRLGRVAKITMGEYPANLTMHSGSRMVLHLIPSDLDRSIDVERVFREEHLYLPPLGVTGYNGPIMSLLGAATTHARLGETTSAYANLFRCGAIEGVYCFGADDNQVPYIVAPLFERLILNTLKEYLKVAQHLRVQLPLFAILSFCNMKGCRLRDAREGVGFYHSEKYRDNDIMPTEVMIEDYAVDNSRKLDDTFTLIWNAFNFNRNY